MAQKLMLAALSLAAFTSPAIANEPEPMPMTMAPEAGPGARYCMRLELTGNVIEPVRCWTREQWAEQGVNVDREWAKEGIRVIA